MLIYKRQHTGDIRQFSNRGKRMNDSELIHRLEKTGLHFRPGLTEDEAQKIEETYAVRLPDSLRKLYSIAVPTADERFPDWTNFSPENTEAIRTRMREPYVWLEKDVENGYWVPCWGEKPTDKAERDARLSEVLAHAPVLLPLFGHRYLPAVEGVEDSPVLSSVGCDTIFYGSSLTEWLKIEFLSSSHSIPSEKAKNVPFWSDLIAFNDAEWQAKEKLRKKLGL